MSDIKTKFINDPEQITPELLEGYVLAYPDQVKLGGENIVVRAHWLPKKTSRGKYPCSGLKFSRKL